MLLSERSDAARPSSTWRASRPSRPAIALASRLAQGSGCETQVAVWTSARQLRIGEDEGAARRGDIRDRRKCSHTVAEGTTLISKRSPRRLVSAICPERLERHAVQHAVRDDDQPLNLRRQLRHSVAKQCSRPVDGPRVPTPRARCAGCRAIQ